MITPQLVSILTKGVRSVSVQKLLLSRHF